MFLFLYCCSVLQRSIRTIVNSGGRTLPFNAVVMRLKTPLTSLWSLMTMMVWMGNTRSSRAIRCGSGKYTMYNIMFAGCPKKPRDNHFLLDLVTQKIGYNLQISTLRYMMPTCFMDWSLRFLGTVRGFSRSEDLRV